MPRTGHSLHLTGIDPGRRENLTDGCGRGLPQAMGIVLGPAGMR